MFWIRAYLQYYEGKWEGVGVRWTLEFESFLGPLKWPIGDCHLGPKKERGGATFLGVKKFVGDFIMMMRVSL